MQCQNNAFYNRKTLKENRKAQRGHTIDIIGEYETKLHSDKLARRFQVYCLYLYESSVNIFVCNVTVILPLKDCCYANFKLTEFTAHN